MENIIVRSASITDMVQVAKLHRECFKNSFLSSLGRDLVTKYYQEFLNEDGPFYVAEVGGGIIGVCMGYYAGSTAVRDFLHRYRVRLAFRILLLCLKCNKLAIQRSFDYLFPHKKPNGQSRKVSAQVDLLSVCVSEKYRGSGIAQRLIKAFEERVMFDGKKDILLSVLASNDRAIAFYKKQGYAIADSVNNQFKMYKALNG